MTARAELFDGLRDRPARRPMIDVKQRVASNPFEGLFRQKLTPRRMADLEKAHQTLDESLARENYLGVRAVHFQMAVDAMLRIGRPDLEAEFKQARDDAIRQLRQTPPIRKRTPKP